jgi:hypothetical protein
MRRRDWRKPEKHELRDQWENKKGTVKYTFSIQEENSREEFLVLITGVLFNFV